MSNNFVKTGCAMIWGILGEWLPPPAVVLYRKDTRTVLYYNLPFPYQEKHTHSLSFGFTLSCCFFLTIPPNLYCLTATGITWSVACCHVHALAVLSSSCYQQYTSEGWHWCRSHPTQEFDCEEDDDAETTCMTRGNIQSIYEGKVRSDFMHALSKFVATDGSFTQ